MRQVLAWAVDHDPAAALRLAVALGRWWWLGAAGWPASTGCCPRWPGGPSRAATGGALSQLSLGMAATTSADLPRAADHFTAARDALQDRGPSRLLADVLTSQSSALLNTGQLAEGTEEGRRALAMAQHLADPAAEAMALEVLGIAAWYRGDADGAIELIRRQQQSPQAFPWMPKRQRHLIRALIEAGDLAAAESACAAALARSRDAGDVTNLATLLMIMAELMCRRAVSRMPPRTCAKGSRSRCGPATSLK